ncbi:MAG: tetratricopeptide repeat protein [Pseudomonadales bacterium]|nr:tetratricopeptide repeat protein [Pseudomonadales bacterium]
MAEHITEEEQIAAIKSWWKENGKPILVGIVLVIASMLSWDWYQTASREKSEAASDLFNRYLETRTTTDSGESMLADLSASYPDSAYQVFALFYQAADAVDAGDLDSASMLFKQVIDGSSSDELVSLAIIRLARIQHEQKLSEDALLALSKVKGDGYISLAAELKGDILFSRGEHSDALAAYEIARQKAGPNIQRPLLEMKIADLAR